MSRPGLFKYVAILSSRQARRPTGESEWVRQTTTAVAELKKRGYGLVSSVGLSTWDLATSLASIHQIPLRLLIPGDSAENCAHRSCEISSDFELSRDLVDFIPILADSPSREQSMILRDQSVIDQVDELWPVSIRRGGKMSSVIETASGKGIAIDRQFEIGYSVRPPVLKYTVDPSRLSPSIRNMTSQYLVHWTRTSNHPWPGERPIDYWISVLSSTNYCRSAFETLKRILSTKCIQASNRHMPAGYRTVAFSGLSPIEVLPLMRWRARYGEMSFEPYGIGIRFESAMAQHILPVSYVQSHGPTCATPWLCQTIGSKTDWRAEREYRHLENLDLKQISGDDLIVFTLEKSEADTISRDFGLKAVSFY